MGVEAGKMVLSDDWHQAVVYREGKVTRAPVTDLMKPVKKVNADHKWIQIAESIGLFV
jgi:hypothetical protein